MNLSQSLPYQHSEAFTVLQGGGLFRLSDAYLRLLAIERAGRFQPTDEERDYLQSLIRQLRHNLNELAQVLGTGPVSVIYTDLSRRVYPDLQLPESIEKWLTGLSRKDFGRGVDDETHLLRMMLGWYWLQDKRLIPNNISVSDPFEPLLQFFELGGWISTEHGFIDFHPARLRFWGFIVG